MLKTSAAQRLALLAVLSTSLGIGVMFGFQPPLIALLLARKGTSASLIGLITAAGTLAVLVLGPSYPTAIRRYGLRGSIVGGIGCVIVLMMAMPFAAAPGYWLGLRFLSGAALGLTWIASEIWLNAASDSANRTTVMGLYGAVFAGGVALGPLLLELTGTNGIAPFAGGAIVLVVTVLPLLAQGAVPSWDAEGGARRRLGSYLVASPIIMLAAATAGLTESVVISLLPLLGLSTGMDEDTSLRMLVMFLAGNVLLQIPIAVLADRHGRWRMLTACALVSAIGPWLLLPAIGHPAALAALMFVWGGTLYAFYSLGIALVGTYYAADDLVGANTVFVMTYCCGGMLGPVIAGAALDHYRGVGLVTVLSVAGMVLVLGNLVRRWQQRAPACLPGP